MNNTFNIGAMDTVYPFIPMYPNGQPQGNFLVNGLSAPVLIPKRAASSPTRHEWFGYLKVMAPATCFLHLHALSSISLSIPAKDLELSTEPGSSPPSAARSSLTRDTTGATSSINTSPARGRKPSSALP